MPLAELSALVLDGQLYRVGDVFATVDTPDTPALRARAFAWTAPEKAVPDRGTAAWIHGTRSMPPIRPQICIDPEHRIRLPATVDAHQHTLAPTDTVTLGRVRVTAPLRTAADLLLASTELTAADALEIHHLLALAEATTADLREHLRRSRRAGARAARDRVAVLEQVRLPEPFDGRLSLR